MDTRSSSRRGAIGLVLALSAFGPGLPAMAPAQGQASPPPAQKTLSLPDLERMALEGNPTLPQARAQARAAQGRQQQVGLYPNPLVGYELEELTAREPGRHKNFLWLQVPIVTSGKIGRSQDLAATETRLAEVNVETQRVRVVTTVRMLYQEAVGAARLVELRRQLLELVRGAVGTSEELYSVGQADRPDVLEIEVQRERAAIDLARAESHQRRVWTLLAAVVGDPALPLTPLADDLDADHPPLDREAVAARLLRESPEARRARIGVERARAAVQRVRAERVPNLFVRTRVGYNSESFGGGRDVGFEAGVEIGVPLPLFDRQQGNLTTAEAEVEFAQREVARIELDLRGRLAAAFKGYEDAQVEVDRYRREILPRAQRSYDLYREGFRRMAAAYPQVLIAQRALFEARAEYTRALVERGTSAALLEGLLVGGGLDVPFHTLVQLPPPTGHLPAPVGRTGE